MKKTKINDIFYNIPESWDEVSLETQIKFADIKEEDEQEKLLKTICLYCKIPTINILKEAPIRTIKRIIKTLEFLTNDIPSEPLLTFVYKDKEYSVIENIEKEEFQDWISINQAIDNNEDNKWKAVPYIIAILTKEDSLDNIDLEELSKTFYDLPVSIANKISSFFLHSKNLSQKIGVLFSMGKSQALKNLNEVEDTLIKQDGGEFVIKSLIGELRSYIQSLEND